MQNPVEAREPSMPIHALQAGHPDNCANLGEIAPLLVQFVAADQGGAGNASERPIGVGESIAKELGYGLTQSFSDLCASCVRTQHM